LDRVRKMDRYAGRIELSDGNRAAFLLTMATHGRAVIEWAFEQSPTKENLEEAGTALEVVFERVFGSAVNVSGTCGARRESGSSPADERGISPGRVE
jgi:hypothetical protein